MSSEEKRKFTRVPFETAIRVSSDGIKITSSRMRNVSLGGMFIVTEQRLPVGTLCAVEIELIGPASLLRIRMEAEVIRVEEDGIAVRFTRTDMDSLIHLKHLIAIHSGDPELIDQEYYKSLFELEPPS